MKTPQAGEGMKTVQAGGNENSASGGGIICLAGALETEGRQDESPITGALGEQALDARSG